MENKYDHLQPISDAQTKALMLDILNYFKDVCEKHNLCHFLSYGTLLGAVRHGGYIPWDDDIDVCMPRADYEKLKCTEEYISGDNKFEFRTYNQRGCIYPFIKLLDNRTIITESGVEKSHNMGIYIDIFPIDNVPDNLMKRKLYFFVINQLKRLNWYSAAAQFNKSGYGCIADVSKYFCYKVAKSIGSSFLAKQIDAWAACYSDNNSKFCGMVVWNEGESKIIPRHILNVFTRVEFETYMYKAPADYDAYLRLIYGMDYMQLPPLNKRYNHELKAWWK